MVVGALVLSIVAYMVFAPAAEPEAGLVSVSTSQQVGTVNLAATPNIDIGQEFIGMLLSLQSLNLDTTLFQDPVFQSLKDKTIRFADPGGQGRPNPFAPIGSDVVAPAPPANSANIQAGQAQSAQGNSADLDA